MSPEAVRAQLGRLLESEDFRYSERLSRFLKYAVEQQLEGNTGQLKETVLAVEIFDREPSYDSHVDSIVRVEARRLRSKLERYYGDAGRTDPVIIALPKGSYAPVFAFRESLPVVPAEPAPPAAAAARTFSSATMAAVGVLCLLAGIALPLGTGRLRPVSAPVLRPMTADPGLTSEPAISPDGKLVAYSSDRSGTGHMDIWVQQTAAGQPMKITTSPGDDREPAFSPDGTLIAYRAEGENHGIYVVPALGGMSTLLAPEGSRPRFSPDGSRVVYWTGERSFRRAEIWTVPAKGGAPVRLRPDFPYAANPVWSPDGRYVLFVGSKDPAGQPWVATADDWDWWVTPVDGGPAVQTFARKVFARQMLQTPQTGWSHRRIVPGVWAPSGDVIFSARSGDRINIWRMPVRPDARQVVGAARAVTSGAGSQDYPSVAADGSIAFSVLTSKSDIYSLPVNADAAEVKGPLTRLTSDAASYSRSFVSRDGKRMAYLSTRTGNQDVWVRDFQSGVETPVTGTQQDESAVVMAPDGSKLAFSYTAPNRAAIYTARFGAGRAAQLCSDCGEPRAWLPDGSGLLFQRFTKAGASLIGVLDGAGRETILMESPSSALFSPSVSEDGRWVVFVVRAAPDSHRVMATPMEGGRAASESHWITIVPAGSWVDKPRWSPNGKVVYFLSNRDGYLCLWAQRLRAEDKTPAGPPLAMAHFHGRESPASVFGLELSVAVDKLVFTLGKDSGNLWLAPSR